MKNHLYYGDNLDILRNHSYFPSEFVDLIYLDPPFKSNVDYNVLFAEQDGSRSHAQIRAFTDTWKWGIEAAQTCEEVIEGGGEVAKAMASFRTFLGGSDMMAYLAMMAPRLIELRRVLKKTGSIYLHCDPTASHYLKMLMDSIFGPQNFVNEIIWHYRKWPAGKYTFQRNHDVILFYSASGSKDRVFNQLYMERAASTLKRFGTAKIVSGHDEEGRRVPSEMADEESAGVRQDDVWNIGRVPPIKQLYPTQKPDDLLRRILRASSNKGDVVLDPFCGCGTTIEVAQELKRRWIGIDITHLALNLIKWRLSNRFGIEAMTKNYEVTGEPVDLSGAHELAMQDRFEFQNWALGLLGARRTEVKKGADQGIDGRQYFHESRGGVPEQIIYSVKSGALKATDIRDLGHVINREKAKMGILIALEKPSKPMLAEAANAGFYDSLIWGKLPRLQFVTVKDLLNGHRPKMPLVGAHETLKKREGFHGEDDQAEQLEFG
jgi:site-specific DNA-methyltransferase (adenine-specific)